VFCSIKQKGRVLFFEKKNPKTFASGGLRLTWPHGAADSRNL
jgi:hypothetical protein